MIGGYLVMEATERSLLLMLRALELAVKRQRSLVARVRRKLASEAATAIKEHARGWDDEQADLEYLEGMVESMAEALGDLRREARGMSA